MKKSCHLALLLFVSYACFAQVQRPKLIIGLVIDQMRWDYLYRYNDRYTQNGFKRLLREGFSCENTFIPYIPSVTAAGHAGIYTGSVPALHGIVGNNWWDNHTTKMYCTDDLTVSSVGTNSNAGKMSPNNLLASTITDELRLATNFRSRTYGIAFKDRGGIIPGGHFANAAYWFDDTSGNWISSTYYMKSLPQWVQEFNNSRKVDSFMKLDWNLLYPAASYLQSTADERSYEKSVPGENGHSFPHRYARSIGKDYNPFRVSPYSNTFTFEFAKKLMLAEKLGKGDQSDFLAISISGTDYIGHRFGPQSLEVEDMYLRLDRDLGAFLSWLDQYIGKGQYLLFLTADHGAPQIPAFLKENKYQVGNLDFNKIVVELNQYTRKKYNAPLVLNPIYNFQVYLNYRLIDSLQLNKKLVKADLADLMNKMEGMALAFDIEDLPATVLPGAIKERMVNGYYKGKSGDIQLIYKPQFTEYTETGTEHGTWNPYDTHIPLLWYGWHIKQGSLNRETYMTDIAATLAALLHIQMPNASIGKTIIEAIR